MSKWPLQKDCNAFYGNPRGVNGTASPAWEKANIISIKPPFIMRYDGKPVKGLRVHKKVGDSLLRIFNSIWEASGRSQAKIDEWGVSIYGGAYNYRLMRGGTNLSMHSWGCAIDLDPARNALNSKKPRFANYPEVVKAFHDEGWEWGGPWSRGDGMHWQAAWTTANAVAKFPDLDKLKSSSSTPAKPKTTVREDRVPITDKATVKKVQALLVEKGWSEVGLIDGDIGDRTIGAVLSFRNVAGLPSVKTIDKEMYEALKAYAGRPVSAERASTTKAELKNNGEEVLITADNIKTAGVGLGLFAGIGGANDTGVIDRMKTGSENLGVVKQSAETVLDIMQWAAQRWWIPVLLIGVYLAWRAFRIVRTRLREFRTGTTMTVNTLDTDAKNTVMQTVTNAFK